MTGNTAVAVRAAVAVLALFPLVSAALVIWSHGLHPPLDDFTAYWLAGEHVRTDSTLYGPVPDPPEAVVYRYAPWFAWLWAPVTLLPEPVVRIGWYLILLAASLSVLLLIPRYGFAGWCAAAVLSPFFVDGAVTGNVSPLMAAGLFHALPTQLAAFAIAATASLKGFPLLFVLVFVGRRDWRAVVLTLLLTALLMAPMFLYDLSDFAFAPLPTPYGLGTVPLLWIASATLMALLALRQASTKHAWFIASLAALAASPHMFLHSFTFITAGMRQHTEDSTISQHDGDTETSAG